MRFSRESALQAHLSVQQGFCLLLLHLEDMLGFRKVLICQLQLASSFLQERGAECRHKGPVDARLDLQG